MSLPPTLPVVDWTSENAAVRVGCASRRIFGDRSAVESLVAMHLEQVALVVDDYDDAIRCFVHVLGFDLIEDSPSSTNDGRPKRWVVVRPPGSTTGLLLAQADGEGQAQAVGDQFAGA